MDFALGSVLSLWLRSSFGSPSSFARDFSRRKSFVNFSMSKCLLFIHVLHLNARYVKIILIGVTRKQSCKNVPTVPTSWCYFFWPVLIFGKSTRKTGENTRKQAKTRENRRKTGAFLVLIFWGENWSVLIFTPFATMVG